MSTIPKLYSLQEASQHSTKEDCWIVINGKVYDVTKFLDDHPGGDDVLLSVAGKDSTEDFEDVGHSESAREIMEQYAIGELDTSPSAIAELEIFTKLYSMQEASQHSTKVDCWIVIDGKVYDVTKFLDDHPGGDAVLLSVAGICLSYRASSLNVDYISGSKYPIICVVIVLILMFDSVKGGTPLKILTMLGTQARLQGEAG